MEIFGYAFPLSSCPGKDIHLYLGSLYKGGTFKLKAHRKSDGVPEYVFDLGSVTVPKRDVPIQRQWEGYDWSPISLPIPKGTPSGLYYVSDDNNTLDFMPWFIIKPERGIRAKVAIIVPVATQNAYGLGPEVSERNNLYGLNWKVANRAHRLSFLRPLEKNKINITSTLSGWIDTQEWKDEKGAIIPGNQFADYYCSLDLHEDPELLDPYALVILYGHDEYWSPEMRDHLENFIRRGGNVASFSGNTAHRQVGFTSQSECPNAMMICYKDAQADPDKDPHRVTGSFHEPPAIRPPNNMLGVGFTYGGMANDPQVPYTIAVCRNYIENSWGHWALQGIGLDKKSFGEGLGLFVYEFDGTAVEQHNDPDYDSKLITPHWVPTGEEGTPLTFTPIAVADLRDSKEYKKPGIAVMGTYVRGGTVFTASTTEWVGNLGNVNAVPGREIISKITRNVVEKLRYRNVSSQWETIGIALGVQSLTACNGRLYCLTPSTNPARLLWMRFPVGAEIYWRPLTVSLTPDATDFMNKAKYLTGMGTRLFGVSENGCVWRIDVAKNQATISPIVKEATLVNIKGVASVGGSLYAALGDGRLRRLSPDSPSLAWQELKYNGTSREDTTIYMDNPSETITAMTSFGDALYAATSKRRIVRSNGEFVGESDRWVEVLKCPSDLHTTGLAVVETRLFATIASPDKTPPGVLAWTDLSMRRVARNWR